eukprot:1874570-Rhodomonas_salina.1
MSTSIPAGAATTAPRTGTPLFPLSSSAGSPLDGCVAGVGFGGGAGLSVEGGGCVSSRVGSKVLSMTTGEEESRVWSERQRQQGGTRRKLGAQNGGKVLREAVGKGDRGNAGQRERKGFLKGGG